MVSLGKITAAPIAIESGLETWRALFVKFDHALCRRPSTQLARACVEHADQISQVAILACE